MGRLAGIAVSLLGLAVVFAAITRSAAADGRRRAVPAAEAAGVADPPVLPSPAAPVAAVDTSARPLNITGRVTFEGEAPKAKKVRGAGLACGCVPNGIPEVASLILVNSNGTLRNVVVLVTKAPRGAKPSKPAAPLTIRSKAHVFVPCVSAVAAGAEVTFTNDDPCFGCVHALCEANIEQNFTLKEGQSKTVRFDNAEAVRVKSDLYPWMRAWIVVAPTPFFDVTDDAGRFELKDLPPGEYTVEARHETLGTQKQTVTLAAGGAPKLEFVFRKP